jgi:c(7)-type cytochrome triheme protein
MKKTIILLTVIIAMAMVGSAFAVPAGKTLDFETSMGKVTFDGKTHGDAGNKCPDCHSGLFQMKKGNFKMKAPHTPGEFCGKCHDGAKAFEQKTNCAKCHKK